MNLMNESISGTWVIITVGNREYAINSSYIQSFTELKHHMFMKEAQAKFVRGTYNIFNSDIIVIDGHKLAKQASQTDRRLKFCKRISDINLKCRSWIDTLDWVVITNETDPKLDKLSREIHEWFDSQSFVDDKYMDRLFKRASEHISIIISRGYRIVEARKKQVKGVTESEAELSDIRKEINRYVSDTLENMAEYYSSQITDLCMIVKASGKIFGLSIDSVKLIADEGVRVTASKRTVLSAGLAVIDNSKYNILDLTKVGSLVY